MTDVGAGEVYNSYLGECDHSGHFTIPDVPPGRYRVGIEHLDPNPQSDEGAFAYDNAKYKREVDGKTPITIDLAKPE
jgi:hypothetical protein